MSINNTGSQPITTYYVYDASGNVLAIYTQSGAGTPTEAEIPVYGTNRLGTYFVPGANYVYEIRDNVGSVRVAINQNKVNGQADIRQYDDYYPFGSITQSGGTGYRYDYQGAYSEKDPVTGYNNFALRMYDGRIGRWLSVDPAGQFYSPYEGMGNNPVMGSDPTGGVDSAWVVQNGFAPAYDRSLNDGDDAKASSIYGSGARALSSAQVLMNDGSTLLLNADGSKTYLHFPMNQGRSADDGWIEAFQASIRNELPLLNFTEVVTETLAYGIVPGGEAVGLAGGGAVEDLSVARALGKAGEDAVGITGPKTVIEIGGRSRIPDALTNEVLTEVKNVHNLSFTRQLRDFLAYSQQTSRNFNLYTRASTTLSGPLKEAIRQGLINHFFIP